MCVAKRNLNNVNGRRRKKSVIAEQSIKTNTKKHDGKYLSSNKSRYVRVS